MRGALTVLWHELEERWTFLAASLLLGLLALTAPLLPAYRHWGSVDVRGAAALVAAGALLLFASLGVGSGILAGGLTSGREGFYLARPVSGFALWAGRLGAALVIGVLAPGLALLPSSLSVWHRASVGTEGLFLLGLLPILVAGGALFRLTVRARSLWLVVLVAGMVLAYAVQLHMVVRPAIQLCGLATGPSRSLPFLAIPVLWAVALVMGSATATLMGRNDLRRAAACGAGTATLLLMVLTVLLVAGFSWVSAVSPNDIVGISAVRSTPAGSWILLSGRASRGGFHPFTTFLVNVEDGWWEGLSEAWGPAGFSDDGEFLALSEWKERAAPGQAGYRIRVLDLRMKTDDRPATVRTFALNRFPMWVALSPHGTHLLTIFGDHFTVWKVRTGRPVARVRERVVQNLAAEVDEDGGVWLVLPTGESDSSGSSGLEVRHLAPRARKTTAVWRETELDPRLKSLHPAGTGGREALAFFVRNGEDSPKLVVRRLRTGKVLWSASPCGSLTPRQVLPLDARQILVTLRRGLRGPMAAVVLATPDGVRWTHETSATDFAAVSPGPVAGMALLTTDHDPRPGLRDPWCQLLDLATGRSTLVGEGLRPVGLQRFVPPPGSVGARLLIKDFHQLVVLDQNGTFEPLTFR